MYRVNKITSLHESANIKPGLPGLAHMAHFTRQHRETKHCGMQWKHKIQTESQAVSILRHVAAAKKRGFIMGMSELRKKFSCK